MVGHLALVFFLPLLLYCATSTAMDLRSGRTGMGLWGVVSTSMVLFLTVKLLSQPLH